MVLDGDSEKTDAHLPMIHIAFSNLKTWLMGTYHSVSKQHLPAYLNEFVFRFNRRFYPMTAFASILGIGMTIAGPKYRGLYDGEWDHCAHLSIGRRPVRKPDKPGLTNKKASSYAGFWMLLEDEMVEVRTTE
jgi:hypothetical protein